MGISTKVSVSYYTVVPEKDPDGSVPEGYEAKTADIAVQDGLVVITAGDATLVFAIEDIRAAVAILGISVRY